MARRRGVLAGLAAAALAPAASWADAGTPSHLTAALDREGRHLLAGLRPDGTLAFRCPLPARGHAAAAHPTAPEAVAFARRPGRFALVLDCRDGRVLAELTAPEGRHFYGHGAFGADGALLWTTENAVDTGDGRLGLWVRAEGWRRVGDVPSGGIGPHEIIRLATGGLAVAHGGIRTHPDSGRKKLNLATMRPNLTLLDAAGRVTAVLPVPEEIHHHLLRHIAADARGRIVCGFQWQGDPFAAPPMVGLADPAGRLELLDIPEPENRRVNAYIGSVAISAAGAQIVATAPRGGRALSLTAVDGLRLERLEDVCGAAALGASTMLTDGLGRVHRLDRGLTWLATHPLAFDNHLVRIASGADAAPKAGTVQAPMWGAEAAATDRLRTTQSRRLVSPARPPGRAASRTDAGPPSRAGPPAGNAGWRPRSAFRHCGRSQRRRRPSPGSGRTPDRRRGRA